MRKIRIDLLVGCSLCVLLMPAMTGLAQSKLAIVTSVQADSATINLGRIDGLLPESEGSIFFEILVEGKKKEVPVATYKVMGIDSDTSRVEILVAQSDVKAGYRVRPARLATLNAEYYVAQGNAYFLSAEFEKALPYYEKITELLPQDPLATHRIAECRRNIVEQAARQKELINLGYYRHAMAGLLNENQVTSAAEYAQRLLEVDPDDTEALYVLARRGTPPAARVLPAQLLSWPTAKGRAFEVTALPREAGPMNGHRMVLIPATTATLGENGDHALYNNEKPAYQIMVPSFYIDIYEVTNGEYQRFVDATGHRPPSHWMDGRHPDGLENYPVVHVSWDDANAYARWAKKRLPTEAEWELAARGTDRRQWPWGSLNNRKVSNTGKAALRRPAEVGAFPDDRSPYGLYDMGGNVSEWTADWYKPYPGNTDAEAHYGEHYKVLRGGSHTSADKFARCAFRAHLPRDYKAGDLGFRCAKDP